MGKVKYIENNDYLLYRKRITVNIIMELSEIIG